MKYNKEIVQQLCDKIRKGLSQLDASSLCDLSEAQFYVWKKDPRKPEFLEALKKAENEFKENNLFIIQKAALEPRTWQAAAWMLERKFHNEYGMKWQGELSGRNGKPLIPDAKPSVDLSYLTKKQLDALIIATTQLVKSTSVKTNGNGSTETHG